jgi:hypothetical protein
MHPHSSISLRGRRPARAALAVETLETRLVPYSVSGNAWPHPQLVTISFVPDGTNLGGVSSNLFATFNARWATSVWENQILRAAQVWAQQASLNFTVVPDSGAPIGSGSYEQGDPTMGDIRIGGYNFNSSTLATGYQPPPANTYSIAGDIQFNTGQAFNIGATYDLFTVAAHEFGHALGLYHSSTIAAVMYGNYTGQKSNLNSDDTAGIQAIYGARTPDQYDVGAGNNSFATATNLDGLIDPSSLTALVTGLDITTTTDVDYYTFTAPTGSSSSLTVNVQSSGLSLLAPTLTVYAADQTTVLGSASGLHQYGTKLSVTINSVTAGQRYYVKVAGADTTAFGTGSYALTLNFGTGPSPIVSHPNTQTAAGSSPQTQGGWANDTFVPNDAVTNATLTAVGGVTSPLTSQNLVPLPGLMPHPPGCACPFCRNGGYAPAPVVSATPLVVNAAELPAAASASRPAGSHSLPVPLSSLEALESGGANPVARGGRITASSLSVPSVPGVVVNAQPTAATSPSAPASGVGLSIGQSGAESENEPPTANVGPDEGGNFRVEPDSNSLLPAAGSVENSDINWCPAVCMVAVFGLTGHPAWDNGPRRKHPNRSGPIPDERRRTTRYPCWLRGLCRPLAGPIVDRCESFAQNLSTAGVSLLLRRPYDEGTLLAVELEGSDSAACRLVLVRVAHTTEEEPGKWLIGGSFDRGLREDEVHKLLLGK